MAKRNRTKGQQRSTKHTHITVLVFTTIKSGSHNVAENLMNTTINT